MKVALELTEDQYELLLFLVFSKLDELDKQEDNLLICVAFSDETDEYNKKLVELKKSLENVKDVYHQIATYAIY
jgi:hypothetical protein